MFKFEYLTDNLYSTWKSNLMLLGWYLFYDMKNFMGWYDYGHIYLWKRGGMASWTIWYHGSDICVFMEWYYIMGVIFATWYAEIWHRGVIWLYGVIFITLCGDMSSWRDMIFELITPWVIIFNTPPQQDYRSSGLYFFLSRIVNLLNSISKSCSKQTVRHIWKLTLCVLLLLDSRRQTENSKRTVSREPISEISNVPLKSP